jgi:hypothetical protein
MIDPLASRTLRRFLNRQAETSKLSFGDTALKILQHKLEILNKALHEKDLDTFAKGLKDLENNVQRLHMNTP